MSVLRKVRNNRLNPKFEKPSDVKIFIDPVKGHISVKPSGGFEKACRQVCNILLGYRDNPALSPLRTQRYAGSRFAFMCYQYMAPNGAQNQISFKVEKIYSRWSLCCN